MCRIATALRSYALENGLSFARPMTRYLPTTDISHRESPVRRFGVYYLGCAKGATMLNLTSPIWKNRSFLLPFSRSSILPPWHQIDVVISSERRSI